MITATDTDRPFEPAEHNKIVVLCIRALKVYLRGVNDEHFRDWSRARLEGARNHLIDVNVEDIQQMYADLWRLRVPADMIVRWMRQENSVRDYIQTRLEQGAARGN